MVTVRVAYPEVATPLNEIVPPAAPLTQNSTVTFPLVRSNEAFRYEAFTLPVTVSQV